MYAQYEAVFMLFHDPTIQVHLVEYGLHDILDVRPVNFKKLRQMPPIPELCYKLLCSPMPSVPL